MNPVELKMEGFATTSLFIGIPRCEILGSDVGPLPKIS